jgi:hypothetical protein
MIPSIPATRLAMLLAGILLSGCGRHDPASANAMSAQAQAAAQAEVDTGAGDVCALLTDAELRAALGDVASGKRDHSVDQYGIQSCVWETPSDRFVVQMLSAKAGTAEDELRSRVQGSVDPTMAGAADRIRYEVVAGVGDGTMMVVEKADPALGILADTAVLATQRGDRIALLFTGTALAAGDRTKALVTLETLGRSAAQRL